MKKYIKQIGKIIILQVVSFVLLVGIVTAAISLPNFTPNEGIVGGKFIKNFDNIKGICTDGKVLNGFNVNFIKNCVD